MALHLPTVAGPPAPPCAGCPAPCCSHYQVALDGRDLHRLLGGLAVPWEDLVTLEVHEGPVTGAFRLDGSSRHHSFVLRQRPNRASPIGETPLAPLARKGDCALLLELPGGHRRCGAYDLRPSSCRVYPLIASEDEPDGSFVYGVSLCPDDNRARFSGARAGLRPLVDDDLGEQHIALHVAARWNAQALRAPLPIPGRAARLVRWLLDLYGALEPLRRGDRGGWQLAAYDLARDFPLPPDPVDP